MRKALEKHINVCSLVLTYIFFELDCLQSPLQLHRGSEAAEKKKRNYISIKGLGGGGWRGGLTILERPVNRLLRSKLLIPFPGEQPAVALECFFCVLALLLSELKEPAGVPLFGLLPGSSFPLRTERVGAGHSCTR